MPKAIFIILLIVLGLNEHAADTILLNYQKKIIADLSGHSMIDEGLFLSSRSTKEERSITREYLRGLVATIGLEPSIQEYRLPNVNPVIDLLVGPFKGANVYSILPSTKQSKEYVILGAHFDSEWKCPGAIDNGTGVAICYGVMRQLAELKERNINVILVYFDQEEENLIGSQAFANKVKKEDLRVHSVHTLDAMGWDQDGDHAVDLELPSEDLKRLYFKIAKGLNIPINATNVNASDHHSFRVLGFNTTGLTDELSDGDYTPFGDSTDDTYETVNFDYVESSTELVYQVFKEIVQK